MTPVEFLSYLAYFIWVCFLLGFGIAIDVVIATLARFRNEKIGFKTWTLPIIITHVTFPMVGYYGVWVLSEYMPYWKSWLCVLAFIPAAWFVGGVIMKTILGEEEESDVGLHLMAILAVSYDAFYSGFPKASQAIVDSWNWIEVLISFFVAGGFVGLFATGALYVAKGMRKYRSHNAKGLAQFNFFGKWVELSVIGGFGILSLWHGLFGGGSTIWSIAIAGIMIGFIFLLFFRRIMANEQEAAKGIIAASAAG